jgi:hypothetical protein
MKIELISWEKFFSQSKGKFVINGEFNGYHKQKKNSVAFSQQANYTDRATSASSEANAGFCR